MHTHTHADRTKLHTQKCKNIHIHGLAYIQLRKEEKKGKTPTLKIYVCTGVYIGYTDMYANPLTLSTLL